MCSMSVSSVQLLIFAYHNAVFKSSLHWYDKTYELGASIDTVFTVRRSALHGLCDRNSVRPSVCHTRALCPHGSTYDHDFFTIW